MEPLLCIGINHHSAPLALREKFAWDPAQLRGYLQRELSAGNADEVLVLSTCNRVEAYFAGVRVSPQVLSESLADTAGVAHSRFMEKAYLLDGEEAIRHLFEVAAGLDSMAVGEHQILGQVARAYDFARECGATGKQLSKLFQAALACGKRVQTETHINQLGASIPALAVKLAARLIPDLSQARVLLVGAGDMAGLAVQAFRKREVARFTAVSRTLESAQALASSWEATADVLTNLPSLVQQADIILTSTTAGSYLLTEEMLRAATAARDGAPLVILDIAVPRNVDPASRQLPHVYLYDIDDLEGQAAAMQGQRQQELHKAQRLVNAEVDNYHHYLQQQRLVPLIKQVRGEAESIRKAEFERALQKMPGVDPEDLKQIDWLTRSIVKKLLHHPTLHLREQATAANGRTELYAEWIKELFGLSHE